MAIATMHIFGLSRHTLKHVLCAIVLTVFSVTAAASVCCNGHTATAAGHSAGVESPDGHNTKHGGGPDGCPQTLETCVTPLGMHIVVPVFQFPPLTSATAASLSHTIALLPPVRVPAGAVLPPSLPLYLQTSRLLI